MSLKQEKYSQVVLIEDAPHTNLPEPKSSSVIDFSMSLHAKKKINKGEEEKRKLNDKKKQQINLLRSRAIKS